MKGLIIKDFFCLKKQLINFAFILAGVIVISIMYVLSYRFGNIHNGILEMVETEQITEVEIVQISSMAILLFMLIPIACTGDITSLFMDDEKASFYKVASSLPVSTKQRIACRFFAGFLFIGIGVLVDFIMIILISSLTRLISFGDFCGILISFASLMIMYISMLITLMYLFGKGKATYANIVPIAIGVVFYITVNFKEIKAFILTDDNDAFSAVYNKTVGFFKHKSYLLFLVAILISAGSYFASVYIADKKREVV